MLVGIGRAFASPVYGVGFVLYTVALGFVAVAMMLIHVVRSLSDAAT